MADLNNFSFTGRLTEDGQYRTLPSGKGVLTIKVACNSGYGNYKRTTFLKVQQWGDSGEKIAQYLKKGNLVAGTCELYRNDWTGKDGKQFVDIVVDVRAIQMLGNKSHEQSYAPPSDDGIPQDIPF